MQNQGIRYRCACGFPCYSEEQEIYHRQRLCLAIRRMLSVFVARERLGLCDHRGIVVGGIALRRLIDTQSLPRFQCTCPRRPSSCPIHTQAV